MSIAYKENKMTLHLHKIYKSYKDGILKKELFNGLDICLPSTGLIGIVGKSGCGKSTLLHIMAGLENVDDGFVIHNGIVVNDVLDTYTRNHISCIFQEHNLISYLNVLENINSSCYFKGVELEKISSIKRYANKLNIDFLLRNYPDELSGGQRQRVAIIRGLSCRPSILLCDEPTSALDDSSSNSVFELLKSYSKDHLVVVVSHNKNLVEKFADNIVDLDSKETVFNFSKQRYPIYKKGCNKKFYFKNKIENSYHYVVSKKKSLLLMLFFQMFIIASSVVLLASCTGMASYYQNLAFFDVSKNQALVNNSLQFEQEYVTKLKDVVYDVSDFFVLENGQLQGLDVMYSKVPIQKDDFKIVDGNFPVKENEIAINSNLHTKDYQLDDILSYKINNLVYDFIIVGIIDDRFYGEDIVYYSDFTLDTTLKELTNSFDLKIIEFDQYDKENQKKILNEMDIIYISLHDGTKDGQKYVLNILTTLAMFFVLISFTISILLLNIVFATFLYQRKKEITLAYCFGEKTNNIRFSLFIDGVMIGVVIAFFGFIVGIAAILICNVLGVFNLLFGLDVLLSLDYFITFVVLLISYSITTGLVGIGVSKKISLKDFNLLLKEE